MTAHKPRRRLRRWLHSMPGMVNCEEFETFILDYLEGDLPAPKRRVFEWHLRLCRECRDYLAAYRASLDLARQAMAADEEITDKDIPEDLVAAVIAARNAE
jgi:anti-sigma factor RsiW